MRVNCLDHSGSAFNNSSASVLPETTWPTLHPCPRTEPSSFCGIMVFEHHSLHFQAESFLRLDLMVYFDSPVKPLATPMLSSTLTQSEELCHGARITVELGAWL